MIIPDGRLNSAPSSLQTVVPFNPIETYKDDFRCISADLRNADSGQSSGSLEIGRPWDAYSDDHPGLMDHLGIQEFLVMGFCIGGPMIHNLLRLAGSASSRLRWCNPVVSALGTRIFSTKTS